MTYDRFRRMRDREREMPSRPWRGRPAPEDWQTDDLGYTDHRGRPSNPRYEEDRYYSDYDEFGYPAFPGLYPPARARPRRPWDESRGRGRDDRDFWDKATDEVQSWFGDDDAERRRKADHRGKGPRGYKRSDERINEDVHDRLTDEPTLDASDISVSVDNGEVTLDGYVIGRWQKRRAEDCVDSVSGVTHVQNNLRVRTEGSFDSPASQMNNNE
ncbi:BON domain-containing protein [Martelella mediterranea]|uniref:BON domain-containing protein n=1 Tax=Martelella mediterranea TaxID=293089 RepID=UPI001E3CEEEB|nr:BON domain-containing protein [Martelella mediterranea]